MVTLFMMLEFDIFFLNVTPPPALWSKCSKFSPFSYNTFILTILKYFNFPLAGGGRHYRAHSSHLSIPEYKVFYILLKITELRCPCSILITTKLFPSQFPWISPQRNKCPVELVLLCLLTWQCSVSSHLFLPEGHRTLKSHCVNLHHSSEISQLS